jgi:hypothetical protein
VRSRWRGAYVHTEPRFVFFFLWKSVRGWCAVTPTSGRALFSVSSTSAYVSLCTSPTPLGATFPARSEYSSPRAIQYTLLFLPHTCTRRSSPCLRPMHSDLACAQYNTITLSSPHAQNTAQRPALARARPTLLPLPSFLDCTPPVIDTPLTSRHAQIPEIDRPAQVHLPAAAHYRRACARARLQAAQPRSRPCAGAGAGRAGTGTNGGPSGWAGARSDPETRRVRALNLVRPRLSCRVVSAGRPSVCLSVLRPRVRVCAFRRGRT